MSGRVPLRESFTVRRIDFQAALQRAEYHLKISFDNAKPPLAWIAVSEHHGGGRRPKITLGNHFYYNYPRFNGVDVKQAMPEVMREQHVA